MSRIMIDLDGPVVDFGSGMMPCLQEQNVVTDPDDHYFGAPKEGFRDRMRTAIRNQGVFARCLPHPDAIDALWKLHLAGNDLYAVSARIYGHDTAAWSYFQTMKWMQKYGAPPMEIILVEHGTNKAPICKEFGLTLAIEDDLRNYDDLAMSFSTTCYLMDRHWNQTPNREDINLFRVFNWAEFLERVPGASTMNENKIRGTYSVGWPSDKSIEVDLSTDATSEFRVIDPETGGEKGRKSARTDLLPADVLMLLAEHYGKGAEKYADRNWEKGYAWSLNYGALLRHLFLWWGGEELDEEGSSHIVAVAWHAIALIAFENRGIGTDDRPL